MTFSKLPSILVAVLVLSLTAPVSNAAVISGKSVGGSSGQAAAAAASAKAIADQKAVVSKLQSDYNNLQKTCASYKGKDQAMMNACVIKANAVAAMLKSETAKLTALAAAANKVKSVSTSTVNANPIVVNNSGISAAEFKKALTRITQLESQISSLTKGAKTTGSTSTTLRKQTLTWIAWVPITWSGADIYSMDMESIKPAPGDHCSGGVIGERVPSSIVPKDKSTTATSGWTTFNCSRMVYVP